MVIYQAKELNDYLPKKIFFMLKNLKTKVHDKSVNPQSYIPGKKVWSNNKYIKTKSDENQEISFLNLFE